MQVNYLGIISFGEPVSEFDPMDFRSIPSVAPFFANITSGGNVSYVSGTENIPPDVDEAIIQAFPCYANYSSSYLVLAKWLNVQFSNSSNLVRS